MSDLITRLEAAEGPDRELDAEIFLQIDPDATDNGDGTFDSPYFDQSHHHPRKYTASIDAALTLVPEGWIWQLSPTYAEVFELVDSTGFGGFCADAPTPANALCIAALKAREASNE